MAARSGVVAEHSAKSYSARVRTLCLMKIPSGVVATVFFAVAGFLLIWGGWLLATDDPDGGRHPAGAFMLVVAVLGGVLGLASLRRSRRP
jgi:hypothetical protein